MTTREKNQKNRVTPVDWRDKLSLFIAALICFSIALSIVFGFYRYILFWLLLGLLSAVVLVWSRIVSRRNVLWLQRRDTIWRDISTQVYSLTLNEAREQLLPLLTDSTLFSTEAATSTGEDLTGFPTSLRVLFSRYAIIRIDGLAIGTALPQIPEPVCLDPVELYDVHAPYRLIGFDTSFDPDSEPLVIKEEEETLYLLEDFGEPEARGRFRAPSAMHYLLARARFKQAGDKGIL